MHISRTAIPSAAAITAALLAGCGGGSPSTTAGARTPSNGIQAAYRFAACMRQHGVTGFPDPVVHQNGNEVSVGMKMTPTIAGSPAFKSAQKACGGILPGPDNATPAQQHARMEHILAFTSCIRNHGITNFPDPTSQGRMTLAMVQAAGIDLHAPGVIAAARACVPASGGAITQADVSRATGSGGPQASGG
jgi:hypothetical protein